MVRGVRPATVHVVLACAAVRFGRQLEPVVAEHVEEAGLELAERETNVAGQDQPQIRCPWGVRAPVHDGLDLLRSRVMAYVGLMAHAG
jgi:hypothetical protein